MKIGFIGCGNMASAMIGGILRHQLVGKEDIMASAKTQATLDKARASFGIRTTLDNREVAAFSEMLILAVKPIFLESVIREVREQVKENVLVVTLSPGKTIEWLENTFGRKVKLIRTMPNTPALVGEGMSGICPNDAVTEEEKEEVTEVFSCFGRTELVPEHMIDVVGGVSGSSPAFVFLFIEALADAAVLEGMPRTQAYTFAAQAVLGSAKMVLETGMHPGELKDMVCSPGGTTIEAIRVLEEKGMRSAVLEAGKACIEKSKKL